MRHLCYNNSIKDERKVQTLSKKIDRRKAYYCVLDTETCNGYMREDGSLCLDDSLVYDLGFAIVDKYGKVYEQRSFIIYETFVGMKEVMKSAYYANKIPQYERDLENGTRKMVRFMTARNILRDICREYKVKAIIAHNARFDRNALHKSIHYITKSEYKYFYPYGIELWDTLFMARDTICKGSLYRQWCEENNYLTKNGQPRATAEILYRYITGKKDFVESHTGLEDVLIEKEIFRKCMSYHKPMRKKLFKD